MTLIESIRNYILTCPFLADGRMNVDYLGEEATAYTIDAMPTTNILKKYVGGDSLRQFLFVFASREYYGSDTLQNIENNGFYEKFADWLENNKELPILSGNKSAVKIEALSPGYLMSNTQDKAQYQIQCKLTYYQEGN